MSVSVLNQDSVNNEVSQLIKVCKSSSNDHWQ